MPNIAATNIVIKRGLLYYRFLYVGLSLTDGSLYVSLKKQDGKGIDVSYHATGMIHYKRPPNRHIFSEPICRIKTAFTYLQFSIPAIDRLGSPDGSCDEEVIFEVPDQCSGRIHFRLIMAPTGFQFPADPSIVIDYHPLFRLGVLATYPAPPVSPEQEQLLVFDEYPEVGLSDQCVINEDEALCRFHRCLNGREGFVYPPNRDGMWRIVTPVPMRIPPKVTITFEDPTLHYEAASGAKNRNADIRFKVKGRGGFIKGYVPIKSILLDAEL